MCVLGLEKMVTNDEESQEESRVICEKIVVRKMRLGDDLPL